MESWGKEGGNETNESMFYKVLRKGEMSMKIGKMLEGFPSHCS